MYKKNNTKNTLFWHDYESFGNNAQIDRPSQFAGIRTDEDLNEIEGSEVNIFCKPSLDTIPNVIACLVTHITPQQAEEKGVNEMSFFNKIEQVLGENGTCGVGYNSINFDDEMTRNGFYRNFKDPYKREWANNCSRWDLINVLRMVHAIKPDTFKVNYKEEDGKIKKSFRLEELSPLNGIIHENAHDALSDVRATIGMAKIIKNKEPELYNLLYAQRTKQVLKNNIHIGKPFLMASPFFGMEHEYLEVLLPVATNPFQGDKWTEVYCIKLTKDISDIINKDAEYLKNALYKSSEDFIGGEKRIPLHQIRINQCPVILPLEYLNPEQAKRLNISGALCKSNIQKINQNKSEIVDKVISIFNGEKNYETITDPDLMIYSGGFWNTEEKEAISKINKTPSPELMDIDLSSLQNSRVPEMLFRFVGRNFPDSFSPEEYSRWINYCKVSLTSKESSSPRTIETALKEIKEARKEEKYQTEECKFIIDKVEEFIIKTKNTLKI